MPAPSKFAFVAMLASLMAVSAAQAATDTSAPSPVAHPHAAASDQSAGKRMHKPLLIRKEIDRTAATGAADAAGSQAKTQGAPLKGVDVKLGK